MNSNNAQNGKGSSPRNCFSKQYHQNYDEIDWTGSKKIKEVLTLKENSGKLDIYETPNSSKEN